MSVNLQSRVSVDGFANRFITSWESEAAVKDGYVERSRKIFYEALCCLSKEQQKKFCSEIRRRVTVDTPRFKREFLEIIKKCL